MVRRIDSNRAPSVLWCSRSTAPIGTWRTALARPGESATPPQSAVMEPYTRFPLELVVEGKGVWVKGRFAENRYLDCVPHRHLALLGQAIG